MRRLLALMILLTGSTSHASLPDPTEAPPVLTVIFTDGDTLLARSTEPRPFDTIRITSMAGASRTIATIRVRRIFDETGLDRTRDALDHRQTIGSPPPIEVTAAKRRRPSRDPRTQHSYPLSEISALGRAVPDAKRDRLNAFTFELGHAFNLEERYSLGGTVFATVGGNYADVGIRPRLRRWLGKRSSVDFAPGIILARDESERGSWRPHGPGFVAQVALNQSKYLGVVLQAHTVRRSGRPYYGYYSDPYLYPETTERDTGVMLGLRVGGTPGLVTGIAASIFGFIGMGLEHQRSIP